VYVWRGGRGKVGYDIERRKEEHKRLKKPKINSPAQKVREGLS
jgi:hypothetical protein